MADKKKPNRLALMGVILVVLLLLVVFAADPFGLFRGSDDQQAEQQGLNKLLCDFAAPAITAFEITPAGGQAFKLVKEATSGDWYIELKGKKYRADMERVDKLLESVPKLRADSEATRNKANYSTYEVDPAAGIGFRVFTDGTEPKVRFTVGKADNSYKGCYVLYGDDPAVYRASANLKSIIAFTADDFRTRKPWQFEPSAATKIVIRPPQGEALEFTKQGEFWQYGANKNANQNLLKETVKKLTEVTVNGYVDEPDPAVAKIAPAPVIEVTVPTGVFKLSLGAPENATLYVQNGDGYIFKTSEYSMKFISELAFDQLTADDTKSEQASTGAGAPPAAPSMPPAATPGAPPAAKPGTPPAKPGK